MSAVSEGNVARPAPLAEVRWGIIGCGTVCEVKSGPAFQKVPGSRLVAVMRRNGALARDFAERHGVPRFYDDAVRLVADPDVNAVYIASPPGSHLEHALLACRAGKAVYLEKPMARNAVECAHMVSAFRDAGVPLFVAYYRRMLPRFRKAEEIVRGGALGVVTGIGVRFAGPYHRTLEGVEPLPWRYRAEESGGGLLLDLGCHTLDVLEFLVGPLEQVSGDASNLASPYDVEDNVVLRFRTASGALGAARWNFASAARADEIVIEGERGELSISTFGDGPLEVRDGDRTHRYAIENPLHIQQPMIAAVVADLLGGAMAPSTGETATRTQAAMDAALSGYYGGRARDFWKDPPSWPGLRRRAKASGHDRDRS